MLLVRITAMSTLDQAIEHLLAGVGRALQHGQHDAAQCQRQLPLRRLLLHRQVQEELHHLRKYSAMNDALSSRC